jgi:hypothetical protein
MAIRPVIAYPAQTSIQTGYPHGKAQNIVVADDGTGTPFEKLWLNDLWGFLQALLVKDGIAPSGSADDSSVSQYYDGVQAAALKAVVTPAVGSPASLQNVLSRNSIYAESVAEIQAANDYLVANVKRGTIHLPENASMGMTTGLTIDASYVGIEGHGALIIGAGLGAGTVAFEIIASVDNQLGEMPTGFRNFTVTGPGKASTSTGFGMKNVSGGALGPDAIVLENVHVASFLRGFTHGAASYPISAHDCKVFDCGTAVDLTNVGTSIVSFFGGRINGCGAVVDTQGSDRAIEMFGTLMDENDKLFTVVDSQLDLHGCQTVASDYSVIPITISGIGAGVRMTGGKMELLDTAPATFSRWVDAAVGSSFIGRGIRMINTVTSNDAFSSGIGQVSVTDSIHAISATLNSVLNEDRSLLADGGFENTNAGLVDNIFISELPSGVTITERTSVAGHLDLGDTSALFRSGSQSLAATKHSNPADKSSFALVAIPVKGFDPVGGRLFWRCDGTPTGSIIFNHFFAKLETDEFGIPRIRRASSGFVTDSAILPVGDTGWVERVIAPASGTIAPAGATHFIVEVDLIGFSGVGESVYFDDMNFNVVG